VPDINIEINPRKAFRGYLLRHQNNIRWAAMMAHRRSGKSFAGTQDLGSCGLTHRRKNMKLAPLRYGYVAPTQQQAKDIIWGYFEEFFSPIPGVKFNQSELHVTLPTRARIRLYSGENYERMRGIYLDGVVIDEIDDIDPVAWPTVIRPTLSDYKGWASFIGTTKGKGALYKFLMEAQKREDWFDLLLKASESGIIPQDELDEIRRDPAMTEEMYLQEYECDWNVATPGAIYLDDVEKARKQGRISDNIFHHEGLPVYSSFDIGLPANTKCWIFQPIGDKINYLCALTGDKALNTPAKWAALLTRLSNEKGWSFGCHFLPHDGETVWLPSFKEAGLNNSEVMPRPSSEWDDINEAKRMFNRIHINEKECEMGIMALEHWKTTEIRKKGHFTNKPEHFWSSHWCKAFALSAWAIACGRTVNKAGQSRKPRRNSNVKVDMGTTRGAKSGGRRRKINVII